MFSLVTTDILNLQNALSPFTGTVLQLSSTYAGTTGFNYFQVSDVARSDGVSIVVVDGYGNFKINYGGLTIGGLDEKGGETINIGGLQVTSGITIYNKGLVITGGVTIESEGLNLESGGMRVTGGASIPSG